MADVLKGVSDALAGLVESAGGSVLRVEGRRRMASSGIAWSADGLVVTAHHTLERDDDLAVGLPGGERAPASLIGRDPSTDLALLRAEVRGLSPARWADPETARVGHLVLALGRPGRTAQATLGIVSALGEAWRAPGGGAIDRFLQTDVVMAPGFSGGPLMAADGAALGMNTSGLVPGLSLAVPAPTVRRVVEALQAHGRVRRGYLGIGAQPARLPAALAEQLGQESGLLLLSVEPGGPAEAAGLLLGDTIVAAGGQAVRGMGDLIEHLGDDRVGQTLTVSLLRGGALEERQVVIGERP